MKYRVLIEPDEDGVYVAEVPALPGCISQGRTRAEAIANIKEAIAAITTWYAFINPAWQRARQKQQEAENGGQAKLPG